MESKWIYLIVGIAIDWMPPETQIDSELVDEIADRMAKTLAYREYITKKSSNYLNDYNRKALHEWAKYFV